MKTPADQVSPYVSAADDRPEQARARPEAAQQRAGYADARADEDDRYLNSRQVRARYADVSDMWLHQRLKDDSGFPKPLEICGRRFWKLSDLLDWERDRIVEDA
jgi:hypothetical protein